MPEDRGAAAVTAFAPAKINLTLHVTGRRPDGYHLLDSLVVFADAGDSLTARRAEALDLVLTGPFAADLPANEDNLVVRAARLYGAPAARLVLDKRLPPASGIGGGSSDAAATLRALASLLDRPLPPVAATAALGADVPVCLAGRPTRMSGIGDVLAPAPTLPALPAVLANPGIALSTAEVFAGLTRRDAPAMPDSLPTLADPAETAAWLAGQRNDLEAPARARAPAIDAALAALAARPGCLLARMSGSGATCFGLFSDAASARAAAAHLTGAHPGWWIAPVTLGAAPAP